MSARFIAFVDDETALVLDKIVSVRSVSDQDIDPSSGEFWRGIPHDAATKVTMSDGSAIWMKTPYSVICQALLKIEAGGFSGE